MSIKRGAHLFTTNYGQVEDTTALFVKNHKDPQHLLEQVMTLFLRGHLDEACSLIECIIEHNNALVSSSELFVLYSKAIIEQRGFTVEAQCALHQALMLDQGHKLANRLQTLCQIQEELKDGLYADAENKLRDYLKIYPLDPYATYILGYHLFWKSPALTEAIELLQNTVEQRPSFLKAWVSLAMAQKKNKNYAMAEEAFQRCLELDANPVNHSFYQQHLQSL